MQSVPRSCLVVEDSPAMRRLLVSTLSSISGLHITEAENGLEGIRKLARTRFDIILTDINMPIMDGLKLVKCVRNDPGYDAIPIIIISTESTLVDRQRGLALGANAYLAKPINPTEVVTVVRQLLRFEPSLE